MKTKITNKISSPVLAFLALLCYWPMLAGRVPFPADLVVQFPPWESLQSTFPGPRPLPPHAEMGDLVTELYPWKAFTRRALASGTMPLWNPALFLGAPCVTLRDETVDLAGYGDVVELEGGIEMFLLSGIMRLVGILVFWRMVKSPKPNESRGAL